MDCEKYAEHLTACALGQSPPALQSELAAHIAGCVACRQAYERAQCAADLVNRGMKALVAGEPSPQFAARLRARVADERHTGNFWAGRFPIVASVLLCVTLAAIVAVAHFRHGGEPAPEPNAASVLPPAPSNMNALARPRPSLREARARESRSYARRSTAAQPEVLVAPGQMAALARFDEALQQYQAAGAHAIAQPDDTDEIMKIEQLQVPPIQVKAIEVPAISDSTGSWGGF